MIMSPYYPHAYSPFRAAASMAAAAAAAAAAVVALRINDAEPLLGTTPAEATSNLQDRKSTRLNSSHRL